MSASCSMFSQILKLIPRIDFERMVKQTKSESPTQKAIHRVLWLGLPAGLIGLAAIALMHWHLSTRVQLELLVDRVAFTVGGDEQTPLVEPMSFRSLTVEHFQSLSFEPRRLEVADPAKYDEDRREYAPGAWQPVTTSGAVTFSPKDPALRPSVSIQTTSDESDLAGKLDKLSVETGARVTLETGRGKPPRVALTIDGHQADVTVTPRGEFLLVADHVSLRGVVRVPVDSDSLEFKAELSPGNPSVVALGEPQSLSLKLRPAAAAEIGFLSPRGHAGNCHRFPATSARGTGPGVGAFSGRGRGPSLSG